MKQVTNKIKESYGKLLLFFFIFLLAIKGTGSGQCLPDTPKADLQAVSIDPSSLEISPVGTIQLVIEMKNNGPCVIPMGEASFTVTFPDTYIQPGVPLNVTNVCGPNRWQLFNQTQAGGFYSLIFRNSGEVIPVGGVACPISFDIRGKGIVTTKPISISLSSSLTALAKTGDLNVLNQSISLKLNVGANTSPIPALIITDFNVKANECNAVLTWKTSSNNIADSFEVEYGINETAFTRVGVLQNKNSNSNSGSTYEYVKDQGNSKGYYRLKIFEKGGKFSYSKTVSINTKCIIKKGF